MINETEQAEREYLEEIKEKLTLAIRQVDNSVRAYSDELKENKEYVYENQSGMDEADMVASTQSINRMAFTGESAVARRRKLVKLGQSPYFGRIDFTPTKSGKENPLYIGIYSFADRRTNLVFDWRAPIASMFYDFELGDAWYKTPAGKVEGKITVKRQYKIREGNMEFMIENAVNIHDDVLQKELSKSSDEKMKNIVATIQRDQNAVIRNETATVMIIQGVAGSGKTSIALHRIAFLLYRFREDISARDILIISPNKVFADYISNVLPELGEEHIPEMGMDELAGNLLENKYRYQTFFEQVYAVLEQPNSGYAERIKFKSSFEFLSQLNRYFVHIENNYFSATEIHAAGVVVPWPHIEDRLKAYHRMPIFKRFPEVINDITHHIRNQTKRKLTGHEKQRIWEAVPRMFRFTQVLDLYKDFFKFIGRPDMFAMAPNDTLEYADVFPLIYCRIRLEGITEYDHVKHLLIDEMQDYTPIQYAVISRLFRCRKTILGDASQRVNPYSASSAEAIEQVFPQAEVIKLLRSYRSTMEITAFAQRLYRNPDLIPMERHGEEPEVKGFESNAEEAAEIKRLVAAFRESTRQSLGIICKTREQATVLHRELKDDNVHLLTTDSTSFSDGIIITTAHLSKGLEFDEVAIPFASARNYTNEVDKSMLYIACTRAMHKLTVLYTEEKTPFFS